MDIRRWFPPSLVGFIGYTAFFFVLFHKLLFFAYIWTHKDMRTFTYPFISLIQKRLWSSDIFWNDLNGFGFPTFLTDGSVFNPIVLFLLTFLSPFYAAHWAMAISLILGAWFCMLLFREWEFSHTASFLTGLIYATALWPWFFNPSNAFITLSLPPLILLLVKKELSPFVRYPCGIALLSLLLLTGFPHFIVVEILAMGFVAGAYAIHEKKYLFSPVFKRFGIILPAAALIGLLRLLPLLAYGKLSTRIDASIVEDLPGIGWNLPFHFIVPEPRTPGLSGGMEIMPYIGLLPLLFVALSYLMYRRRRPLLLTCCTVFAISLLLAAGPSFLHAFPLYSALGSPARWFLLGKLALLPMIALGCESALQRLPRNTHLFLTFSCLVLGMFALPLILSPVRSPESSFAQQTDLDLPLNANIGPILMIIGLLFLLPLLKNFHKNSWNAAVTLACMATLYLGFAPLVTYDITEKSDHKVPPISLPDSQVHIRALSFLSNVVTEKIFLTEYPIWTKDLRNILTTVSTDLMIPNINLHIGLPFAEIYEPLLPKRTGYLLGSLGAPARIPKEFKLMQSANREESVRLFQERKYLLDSMSITHVFSSLPLDDMRMEKILTYPLRVILPERTIDTIRYIYANTSARTPIYFAPHVVFQEPNMLSVQSMMLKEPAQSERTFVECPACTGTFIPSASAKMTFVAHSTTQMILRTQSAIEQWLIASHAYLPGWNVTIDGKEIQPALAQSIFFAIPVPPGNHIVSLRFSLWVLLRDSIALLFAPENFIWLQ
ncbi:hypothetical protein A3D11_03735 [Candidatus Peribacteria bacterium RIFCSPHIGHO2_02_FULL_49_16]|nr:MAG: hypothetical protein A2880_04695 [Candidatus Peribacteria bacterium RIFCSPHIGHO2_01_FULL_49_38]OGJ58845.1 MAG: hypothetical protein A3D11_03735 [Candidatus Peribacteria bacterium RIFCSPHIGHO2_02_FULL_49_16]